jgi:hypothetical protein
MFVRYLHILNLVMSYFPENHPFLLGQSYLISAATILPGAQLHFGYWLVQRLGLVLTSPGPVDPTIIGELYLNFGWTGIVVGMLVLGLFLRALFIRFALKTPISRRRLVLMVLVSTSLMAIVGSGIILVLFFDLLPVALVFLAYSFCVKINWYSLKKGLLSTRTVPTKA